MKTVNRSTFLLVALLVANPVKAMQIKTPDIAENGSVIPVEITLDQPMTAGQRLDLLVNGDLAAQVRVVEGKLSLFTTRVKGSQNNTAIVARVIGNGRELDSASRNVGVTTTSPVGGSPTPSGDMRVRTQAGDFKVLMTSNNGFAGTLVVQDAGFRAEISGSAVISRNPFVALKGEFSDQVSASIDGRTQLGASPPVAQRAGTETSEELRAKINTYTASISADIEKQQAANAKQQTEHSEQNGQGLFSLLGNALAAAAGGANATERRQLALNALAAGEPSTSSSGTSGSSSSGTSHPSAGTSGSRKSVGLPGARPARIRPGHNMANDATDCLELSKVPTGYKYINNCPYDIHFAFAREGDLSDGGGPTGGKGGGSYTWQPLYHNNEPHTYIACRLGKISARYVDGILSCE